MFTCGHRSRIKNNRPADRKPTGRIIEKKGLEGWFEEVVHGSSAHRPGGPLGGRERADAALLRTGRAAARASTAADRLPRILARRSPLGALYPARPETRLLAPGGQGAA